MNIPSKRLAVLVVVSALAWRCGAAEPVRAASSGIAPIDLPAAIRLALAQPGVRAAGHEVAAAEE